MWGSLEEMSENVWDHERLDSWWKLRMFKITNVKNQAAEFKWTQMQIILVSMACWFCQNIDMRRDFLKSSIFVALQTNVLYFVNTHVKSVYFSWLLQTSQDILTHFPVATLFQMSYWQANFANAFQLLRFSSVFTCFDSTSDRHLVSFESIQNETGLQSMISHTVLLSCHCFHRFSLPALHWLQQIWFFSLQHK